MEINDLCPVQKLARTTNSNQRSYRDPFRNLPGKARIQFSHVLSQEDGAVYRVVDKDTESVLSQVPTEHVLRVAKRVQLMLLDKKAG